jgi:hypothetical protein
MSEDESPLKALDNSHFGKLPRELRDLIYDDLILSQGTEITFREEDGQLVASGIEKSIFGVTGVCKLMRTESLERLEGFPSQARFCIHFEDFDSRFKWCSRRKARGKDRRLREEKRLRTSAHHARRFLALLRDRGVPPTGIHNIRLSFGDLELEPLESDCRGSVNPVGHWEQLCAKASVIVFDFRIVLKATLAHKLTFTFGVRYAEPQLLGGLQFELLFDLPVREEAATSNCEGGVAQRKLG